jgi:hypothetical protein
VCALISYLRHLSIHPRLHTPTSHKTGYADLSHSKILPSPQRKKANETTTRGQPEKKTCKQKVKKNSFNLDAGVNKNKKASTPQEGKEITPLPPLAYALHEKQEKFHSKKKKKQYSHE